MSERSDPLYLADILDAIEAIEEFVRDIDFEAFASDCGTQSAVIRELEVVGEAAGSLSAGLKERYPRCRLADNQEFSERPGP